MLNGHTIILALYPNAKGLGYVCLEQSQKIVDSGIVTTRLLGTEKLLLRIRKFIEFYTPTVVVLRSLDMSDLSRSQKAKMLIEGMHQQAEHLQIPLYTYNRQQIRDVFEQFGAQNKNEIAQKIIEWFPQLTSYAPKIRKAWMDESYYMGVFDAVALAITHQYLVN